MISPTCDVCYTGVNCRFREQRFVNYYSVHGTMSALRNRFLSVIGSRTLGFGRKAVRSAFPSLSWASCLQISLIVFAALYRVLRWTELTFVRSTSTCVRCVWFCPLATPALTTRTSSTRKRSSARSTSKPWLSTRPRDCCSRPSLSLDTVK